MKLGGMGGVYVSHDLAVVAQIADRIVVLKGGEVQEEGPVEQILHHARHPYTRELLAAFEPVPYASAARFDTAASKRPILEVRDVVAGYGAPGRDGLPAKLALRNVSCRLERGQNLGVIGESGSGKSTLARAIAGLLPPVSGKVLLDAHALAPKRGCATRKSCGGCRSCSSWPIPR